MKSADCDKLSCRCINKKCLCNHHACTTSRKTTASHTSIAIAQIARNCTSRENPDKDVVVFPQYKRLSNSCIPKRDASLKSSSLPIDSSSSRDFAVCRQLKPALDIFSQRPCKNRQSHKKAIKIFIDGKLLINKIVLNKSILLEKEFFHHFLSITDLILGFSNST